MQNRTCLLKDSTRSLSQYRQRARQRRRSPKRNQVLTQRTKVSIWLSRMLEISKLCCLILEEEIDRTITLLLRVWNFPDNLKKVADLTEVILISISQGHSSPLLATKMKWVKLIRRIPTSFAPSTWLHTLRTKNLSWWTPWGLINRKQLRTICNRCRT